MSIKYTTKEGNIIVDDDNILISRYGKPFIYQDVSEWKLVGYMPPGGVVGKDWVERLYKGCCLVFFDETMDGLTYESNFPKPPKITGKVKYHFSSPVFNARKVD